MPSVLALRDARPPSYTNGYARCAGESQFPELWKQLVGAWVPALGQTGVTLRNVIRSTAHGTIASGFSWGIKGGKQSLVFPGGAGKYVDLGDGARILSDTMPFSLMWRETGTGTIPTYNSMFRLVAEGSSGCSCVMRCNTDYYYTCWAPYNAGRVATFGTAFPQLTNGASHVCVITGPSPNSATYTAYTAYCDGKAYPSAQGDFYSAQTTAHNYIGWDGADDTLVGALSVVAAWRRQLSANHVAILTADPVAFLRLRTRVYPTAVAPSTAYPVAVARSRSAPPSYTNGYAKCAGESAYPELWRGLVSAVVPQLGVAGLNTVPDLVRKTPLTMTSGWSWSTNKFGPCLKSSSTTVNPTLTFAGAPLNGCSSATIFAIGGTSNINSSPAAPFFMYDNGVGNGYMLTCDGGSPAGKWRMQKAIGYASGIVDSDAAMVANQVYRLVGVDNNGAISLWVDGKKQTGSATKAGAVSGVTTNAYHMMGYSYSTNTTSCLWLWRRALKDSEILLISADPLAPFRLRTRVMAIPIASLISGTVCWGHVTGVTETNVRTFADHWTGDGTISGSGDNEIITLLAGESMVSETVNTGAQTVELTYNQYLSGSTVVVSYRTGATQAACEAAAWTAYTGAFASSGYVQAKVASTM